jgi:predicted DNA-binding transcriptional regulator YafY
MDRMGRIFRLHQLFAAHRYAIPRARLERELECSRATLTRVLAEMRDLLGAPIEFDADAGGYRYSHEAFELPGLWFTPPELYALLAAQKLLEDASPACSTANSPRSNGASKNSSPANRWGRANSPAACACRVSPRVSPTRASSRPWPMPPQDAAACTVHTAEGAALFRPTNWRRWYCARAVPRLPGDAPISAAGLPV